MSLLSEAQALLHDQLAEDAGEWVTYTRLGETPLRFLAQPGRRAPTQAMVASGKVSLATGEMDWLVRVSVLAVGEPLVGDQITQATGKVWEAADGNGEPCFRPDPCGTVYRIRMKEQ